MNDRILNAIEKKVLGAAVAPLATVFIWSGNVVVTEAASGVIAPGSIAFYRWLIAFLILLVFLGKAAWQNRSAAIRHWMQLGVLGGLGMVVYQSLAYEAAKTTTAVNMGVMLALMPLMSALLANLLAGERLSAGRVAGGFISLIGLTYLTSHGEPATLLNGGFHMGDGLMLIAIAANSLYGVLLRRWVLPLSMWLQLFWQIGFATLLLLPVWLMGTISPISSANLPLILYAAIPTSLIAPLYWMTAIRRLGAARTALFINLLPIIVAALAWAVLGEQLHTYHAVGGALALLGVAIGLYQRKAEHAPPDQGVSQSSTSTHQKRA